MIKLDEKKVEQILAYVDQDTPIHWTLVHTNQLPYPNSNKKGQY